MPLEVMPKPGLRMSLPSSATMRTRVQLSPSSREVVTPSAPIWPTWMSPMRTTAASVPSGSRLSTGK